MTRAPLIVLVLCLPLLGGCMETFRGAFENRVLRTVDDSRCMVASRWGVFAIGSDLAQADCDVVIEALRLRDLMRAMEAASKTTKGPGL